MDNVDCSYFVNLMSLYWYKSCLTRRVNFLRHVYAVVLSEAESFAVFHRSSDTIGASFSCDERIKSFFTTVDRNGQNSGFGKGTEALKFVDAPLCHIAGGRLAAEK